jgi:hypothetical protein
MILRRGVGQTVPATQIANITANCTGWAAYLNPLCWGCMGGSEACWLGSASSLPPGYVQTIQTPAPAQTPTPSQSLTTPATPCGSDPITGIPYTADQCTQIVSNHAISATQQAIAGANPPDFWQNIDWSTWLPIIAVASLGFMVVGQAFGRGGRRR